MNISVTAQPGKGRVLVETETPYGDRFPGRGQLSGLCCAEPDRG